MSWRVRGAAAAFLCLCVYPAAAQNPALMPAEAMNRLIDRSIQLMQSGAVAIPELNRAGAPLIENVRGTAVALVRAPGGQSGPLIYTVLNNVRAYLTLSEAVPRPFPFPEEANRQFAELRDNATRLDAHFRALLDLREVSVRNPDRDNLRRYSDANLKIGAPVPGRNRVVFLGDSITDGWRLNEYFTDRDFINRGISGQVTGEMLGRMKADVIDLKPAAVLILAGTNDLARGVAVNAIENNLAMIADLCVFHKIKPIFSSVLPVSDYHKNVNPNYEQTSRRSPALIGTLNAWLKSFCSNRGFTYLDYFPAMADEKGMMKADIADDGLHPNASGYRIMAPLVLAAVDKALPPPAAAAQQTRRKR